MNDDALERELPHSPIRLHKADEFERYFADGEKMLQRARAQLLEADQAWRRRRSELVDGLRDELARLDAGHDKTVAALRGVIARLEAMR
jgi:hypothetical protein